MVFGEILRAISAFFEALLRLFGMSGSIDGGDAITAGNSLRVFIKYAGKTITADLNPHWSIKQVKDVIAPKLGVEASEIRIIFAGNELPDEFVLESSDVGQQSYLHAVRVKLVKEDKAVTSNGGDDNPPTLSSFPPSSPSKKEGGEEEEEGGNLVEIGQRTRGFSTGEPSKENLEETIPSTGPPSNTRSDFFVYCATCDDLKEGKLRVRCGKCLSGAFTVARHPQDWNDVLTPNQIEGICEVESCNGHQASFYFKCSSHITSGEDDSSPPLQQIKRNLEAVPCLACGDPKDLCLVFTCPGGHATCIECFKQYSIFKISQRDFIQDASTGYTLGCPALCPSSLIGDPHHFKLMGRQQYDRYQRFATEECLLQMGGIFCPQPDCGMGIIPEDENCNKIACLHGCGYVFCKRCLEGWHIGPCPQQGEGGNPQDNPGCSTSTPAYFVNVDRLAQAQWQDATKKALRLSTKPCPNCRVPTERAGGCMHMECTKCKFQWCWVCQTKWNRDCMGNHWFG